MLLAIYLAASLASGDPNFFPASNLDEKERL
jgi:hypothetical protein